MVIQSNQYMLLLRYNNYGNTDFINEHKSVIDKNGFTWVLKIGKEIPNQKLNRVLEEGGVLFFRAPKASGGTYHIAKVEDYAYGKAPKDNIFPEYYHQMENDRKMWQLVNLQGTWLRISTIDPLPEGMESALRLVSNSKMVSEVVTSTRSSVLYVTSDRELLIERAMG